MSISAKLSDIRTAISSAYSAISAKGGTVPSVQTLNALPTAIQGIPSYSLTTYTSTITSNGVVSASAGSGNAFSGVNITVSVPTGGTDSRFKDLVERTTTSFEDSTFTTIGGYAFASCTRLTTVSLPNCTTIGYAAFSSCTSLTIASFPNCTTIGNYAFIGCASLTTISFPNCTTIGHAAFSYCSSLTTVSFPSCTSIGGYAFAGCTRLTTVSFPSCTSIGDGAFRDCRNLTTVSFPSCTSIGGYAFAGCTNLTRIFIGTSNCVIGYSTFSSTGIWSNKGTIYVPSDYVDSYKTATNWTYFSNRIFGY